MSSKLSGDLTGAAKTALANPPKGTKKSSNKTASCDVFLQVVKKARDADIEKIVSSLNQEELETAMKYCYRAMSNYKDCAAVLSASLSPCHSFARQNARRLEAPAPLVRLECPCVGRLAAHICKHSSVE